MIENWVLAGYMHAVATVGIVLAEAIVLYVVYEFVTDVMGRIVERAIEVD